MRFGIFSQTDFRLTVGRPPNVVEQQATATLATGGASETQRFTGGCASTPTVVMDLVIAPEVPGMLVNSITANHAMTVTHGSRRAVIAPGSTVSNDLDRAPYEGNYHIEIPTTADERCSITHQGSLEASLTVFGSCPEDLLHLPAPPAPSSGVGLPEPFHQCGHENQLACAGVCEPGLVWCNLSVCRTREDCGLNRTCSGAALSSSANTFTVGFIDPFDCAIDTTLRLVANSLDEALQCAAAQAPAGTRAQPFPPVSGNFGKIIGGACNTVGVTTLGDGDLARCAQHIFCDANCATQPAPCDCRLEPGSCPTP